MKNPHRSKLYGAVLILAFSVAACGGGGGGGATSSASSSSGDSASTPKSLPAVQSVIDQGNYVRTAAHAYLTPESMTGLTQLNAMFLSGVSIDAKVPGLAELATDMLRQLVGNRASTVTAVVQSASCPDGGTMKVSISADSLDSMQPGDVATIEARNCGVSGLKISGGLMLTLKEGSAAFAPNGVSHSVMQYQFTSLSLASDTETALMDGDMTAKYDQSSAGDITVVLSGDSFRTRLERGGALVMDHTMLGFESSAAATIAGRTASRNYMLSTSSPSFRDLYVEVKTITPLVYGAGDNPVSGSILVTGAASSVTITAVDAASVRLDLSARGDGVITESRTMPWPEFEKSF
jgi:hypothetical protein